MNIAARPYVVCRSNFYHWIKSYPHKEKFHPNSFTAKYNCKKLVYYRWFDTIIEAIAEEKRIKGGSRKKKEALINSMNPDWKDLYKQVKLL